MTRKLLPYEYELIKALKITKEEYLDFLAAQHDFTRSPEEKLEELRGEPVSIVLAVVGLLFSAASYLLTPKPELPEQQRNQRQRREQVFSPRFGFNSQQELAKYGDTVNLVYCNIDDNPTGGVRVATSLIWSAVHSEGSSQFMQMCLAIGASDIEQISLGRIAFGQTPIRQFAAGKTWAYLGSNGPLTFANLFRGDFDDPTRIGESSGSFAYRPTLIGDQHTDGFSQAFSPSTMIRFGVYAPIPINVQYIDRDDDGKEKAAPLGISIEGISAYWPTASSSFRPVVPVGHRITLVFARITSTGNDTARAARELRRTLSSYIDAASVYKLGSAQFRVAAPIKNVELDDGSMRVQMDCIVPGVMPTENYGTEDFKKNGREAQAEIVDLKKEVATLEATLLKNEPILKPDIGTNVVDKLGEIRLLKDLVDSLESTKWTSAELDALLANAELFDPTVIKHATGLDAQRDERKGLEDLIEDELDKPSAQRNRANIRAWRARKVELNKSIKRAQAKLGKAFEQYLRTDSPIPGRGKTIKQEKEALNAREQQLNLEIQKLTSKANNLDLEAMEKRDAELTAEINANKTKIESLEQYLANPNSWNNFFNTKCMVKMEEAAYETITPCRVVDFAIKAKVFKRIQGRQKRYGEEKADRYRDSDNGTKLRSAFFYVLYRRGAEATWTRVPVIFTIRRGADVDNFISLKFIAADNIGKWQFRFEPIAETAAEMTANGTASFGYIENSGDVVTVNGPAGGQFTFLGSLRSGGRVAPLNANPYEVDEWGLFSMRSDTQTSFSFEGGPEFSITAVTEQRTEAFSLYPNLYKGLTLLGFNAYSGQGIQDLRSVSVLVFKGKKLRRLRDDGTYPSAPDGSSSYAPDIFLDTILDPLNGIGRFAKIAGVDLKALALAKRFCRVNRLFMDGVIAERTAWRQFWAEVAPYSLLELGRIGGRETLVPAVPCDNAGNITRAVSISALFNQGNILEDSYREEFLDFGSDVQDLIASVIYRDTESDDAFPRNQSVEIRKSDVEEASAVRQTFDLSQYVTNRSQAIMFGKLLCNQRRHVRTAVEFRTFPTDSPLAPGAYIYVATGRNQWDQVTTGVVEAGGVLNTPIGQPASGSGYRALLYKPGSAVTSLSSVTVSGNTASALASYAGWMFVLGYAVTTKRVFRVTEVQMDEEGEVTVKAVEHPCVESGSQTLSLIADFSDNGFVIR